VCCRVCNILQLHDFLCSVALGDEVFKPHVLGCRVDCPSRKERLLFSEMPHSIDRLRNNEGGDGEE